MKRIIALLFGLTSLSLIAQEPTATLKIGTIINPQPGTVLVPVTCEAIDNPIIGNNLVSSFGWYFAYDTQVLYAGEPGTPVTFINLSGISDVRICFKYYSRQSCFRWNTLAIIYVTGAPGSVYPGDKFFDIQFTYSEGSTDEPNIIWTTSPEGFENNMSDDEGNEFLLTLVDGYAGPQSNDVTFHVTNDGNDLEGAMVTVGNDSIATNNAGLAVFNLQDGDYTYTVTKDGYAEEEGSFTVAGEPMQIEVEMEPCWVLVLHLIGQNGTITDSALVIVNNDTVWTTTGTAAFCVTDLTINYEVYIEGYYPETGSLIWSGSGTIQIIMFPVFYTVYLFSSTAAGSLWTAL